MRVLITGASSFVGAHLALSGVGRAELVGLHSGTPLELPGVRSLRLDLGAPDAVPALRAVAPDVVMHMACKVMGTGDGRQETEAQRLNRRMMDAVLALGKPVIYGSSTCVHWPEDTGYAQGRREDEARLAASGLPWVALRPCAPYGPRLRAHQPRHKESFHTLAQWVDRSPFVPLLGLGRALRQPIHLDDFGAAAWALADQLSARGVLPNRAFDAGGAEALPFVDIVHTLARLRGRRVLPLPIPIRGMVAAARFLPGFEPALLRAARHDDPADPRPLQEASGVSLRAFEAGALDLWTLR